MKSAANWFIMITAVAMLIGGYYYFSHGAKVRTLNYFGPVEKSLQDHTDSMGRHVIYDFHLSDQTGRVLTRKDFSNSICVVDFFFTSCQGICPRMNNQMQRVYETFKGNRNVQFISHTVNPEKDSVPVLAEYAAMRKVNNDQWHFVTGDKKELYQLARRSYLISDTNGDGGKEDFVHSQNFALVDKEGHIRGLYDGLDSTEVNRLMVEMNVLLNEYR
jgi:protein SCO1/2